jgi:hypothetical protein
MMYRRNSEAAERARQRQQREDEAARLHEEVPRLSDLKLEISFRRGDTDVTESSHIRRVVVGRAPALFFIPCSNRDCQGGGHEVTLEVMRSLRAGMERFEGTHTCGGTIATAPCSGIARWIGIASYR